MTKKNRYSLGKDAGETNTYVSKSEKTYFGFEHDEESNKPYVALKYFDPSFECFSAWEKDELASFSKFVRNFHGYTWADITQAGGLRYKIHHGRNMLPKNSILNDISDETTLFELRLSDKVRLHGFRSKAAFFLVWLDRNHRIYRM